MKNKKSLIEILKEKVSGVFWTEKDLRPEKSGTDQWYKSCRDLPLNRFILCMIDNEIKALVIAGNPSDDQLHEAWAGIYYEYIDLNQSNEQFYVILLERDIAILSWTINAVEHAMYFMTLEPQQALVDIIVREGFEYTFQPEDVQTNIDEIASIQGQLAPMKMQAKMKQKELDDYNESRQQETITAGYFTKMLRRCGKMQGYAIKAQDITVQEFMDMVNDYLNELKTKKEVTENGD